MSELQESDDLSLEEKSFRVKIGGEWHIVVEATSEAATGFRNIILGKASMQDGKISGLGGVADAEPFLVSRCVFRETPEGRQPVTLTTVKSWPYRVTRPLFDKAKELSGLNETDGGKEAAKNS